jgi:hypothetical protein
VAHTVFGDIRQRARAVYRVTTEHNVYIVGVHDKAGRRYAIVRGEPGTDREHVVVRDSDPRVGEHSLFELPIAEWPGKLLEIAMMTTSTITSAVLENDPVAIAAVGIDGKLERSPWARPGAPEPPAAGDIARAVKPPGFADSPAIVPGRARGTSPAAQALEGVARQVVVGQAPAVQPSSGQEPEVPYPQRHVNYAESAAALLRSIARRDRLFEDVATQRDLRERLRRSLDDCADLLEQIRRRDRR